MYKAETTNHNKILVVAAAAAATLTFGAGIFGAGSAAASTDTTEPPGSMPAGTVPADTEMADHSEMSMPTGTDGSAEPTSPEAAAFCAAELAAEAAANSEDPALIAPAFEAVVAAAPEEIASVVQEVVAAAESEAQGPAFDVPYAAVLDYMRANCGYAELNITGSEYAFGGLPAEVPAGPTIIAMENIGEEVHEIAIIRVNADVTLTLDELLALSEEESATMTTFVGIAFAFPGTVGQTVVDLTPGRYVALCFLPENADPEMISQMGGPEDTAPAGNEFGPPHFTLGMVHELQAV